MKVGIIGSGNMASALAKGFLKSGSVKAENLYISDASAESLEKWADFGVSTTTDNVALCNASDVIIYAVKPNVLPFVMEETAYAVKEKTIVSIAAGVTLDTLQKSLGENVKIIRAMPNTPAQVNCGMTVLSPGKNICEDEVQAVQQIFEGAGCVAVLDEKYMNAAIALHGSSPAYIYMLIDAMADCGVKYGIPKDIALLLASKAVEGSAKMVIETKQHPQVLKDAVCSPGGTTIAAVLELEQSGFSSAIARAIDACVKKADEMSKN